MAEERTEALFAGDGTHTTQTGADLNASLIVAGLKGIHSPLALLLSAKGQAVVVPLSLGNSNSPESGHPQLPALDGSPWEAGSPGAKHREFLYLMGRNHKGDKP